MEHLNQYASVFEIAKMAFETSVSFFGFLTALWVVWRKAYKSIQRYTTQVDTMVTKFEDMVKSQEKLVAHQQRLTEGLAAFGVKIEGREKDILRLEGAMDATRKDMIQLVSAVQQTSGSLDGLWHTLQILFPSQVPKRASDRT